MRRIPHGDIEVALHELRGPGKRGGTARLLLVHGLGGSARDWLARDAADFATWPGAILAIDLAGHGESDARPGGAYTPELYAGDVDAALAVVGPCHLAGEGLGAWVCLLVAGARRDLVPATLLLPGAGLAGGGALPGVGSITPDVVVTAPRAHGEADPLTHACALDIRPVDYARTFAAAARTVLVSPGGEPAPWWDAVLATPGVRTVVADRAGAMAAIAATASATAAAPSSGVASVEPA